MFSSAHKRSRIDRVHRNHIGYDPTCTESGPRKPYCPIITLFGFVGLARRTGAKYLFASSSEVYGGSLIV